MPVTDLTTAEAVAQYMGSQGIPKNLGSMISQVSRAFNNYMERGSLLFRTVTETYDGLGNTRLTLRQFPALSVSVLTIRGVPIKQTQYTASGQLNNLSPPGYGFLFAPWDGDLPGKPASIDLVGACFPRLPKSISVTYQTGYVTANEAAVVASGQVTPQEPQGNWVQDAGVTYATGVALTKVAANPLQGQYTVPSDNQDFYGFNAADEGVAVLISYSFVPSDLEEACIEQVAERLRYATRIGLKSASQSGQETVSYNITDIPPYVRMALNSYRRVVPLGN